MAQQRYEADAKYLKQEYKYTAWSEIRSRQTEKLTNEVTVIRTA